MDITSLRGLSRLAHPCCPQPAAVTWLWVCPRGSRLTVGGGCPGVRRDVLMGKVGACRASPSLSLARPLKVVQPCSVVTWS